MTLVKQLWIGIIFLLTIALCGSFLISTITAKYSLEQQLQLKNIDTATALALSLSYIEKDPVTLEALLSAQFDSGHYESIRLVATNGTVLVEQHYNSLEDYGIPAWFTDFLPISVDPGEAQIEDAAQQYATLYIQSQPRYAEEALWLSTVHLLQWLLVASLVCGITGTTILRFITSPLNDVIDQAEAIGQRHFIMAEEPKTREFKLLVQAMNQLSASVKRMLKQETHKLELLQNKAQLDPLTQLPNREHFLNLLESSLTQEESSHNGGLCIIRILDLAKINHRLGHQVADRLLQKVASVLIEVADENNENYTGRLNGTDFAFVSFSDSSITATANRISLKLGDALEQFSQDKVLLALPITGSYFKPGESRSSVLARLDGALGLAEQKGNQAVITLEENAPICSRQNSSEWRQVINTALKNQQIKLGKFPVRSITGELLHYEMPVRLKLDEEWQTAGYFIGWAVRLRLLKEIDLEVLQLALEKIKAAPTQLAINMSEGALCNVECRTQIIEMLEHHSDQASLLWIEFPEACAVRHLTQFRQFCLQLSNLGSKVGLEHVGLEVTKIRELHDVGLHYIKIDSAIIKSIHHTDNNHDFVKTLCSIGHTLGITMIAEGVMNKTELDILATLGLDAATGPGISNDH